MPVCQLCRETLTTIQYSYTTYSTRGARCAYLVPRCTNYKGAHIADARDYEVLLAIKTKKATTTSL